MNKIQSCENCKIMELIKNTENETVRTCLEKEICDTCSLQPRTTKFIPIDVNNTLSAYKNGYKQHNDNIQKIVDFVDDPNSTRFNDDVLTIWKTVANNEMTLIFDYDFYRCSFGLNHSTRLANITFNYNNITNTKNFILDELIKMLLNKKDSSLVRFEKFIKYYKLFYIDINNTTYYDFVCDECNNNGVLQNSIFSQKILICSNCNAVFHVINKK